MAKAKDTKRVVDSYTIKGTNKVVKAGDCVLMKPCKDNVHSYVARVEKIEAYNRNNMKVRVRWYYWPEETFGGRKKFHGAKELFLSDHYDIQSAQAIYGKCIIHSFKNYTKLQNVEEEDYYCRFEYKPQLEKFLPDHVAVYCKCEMPYNPDDLMIQCEECKDWFHPECIDMTVEEAKQLKEFVCSEHSIDEDVQKPTKRVCSEHSSVEDMKKPTTLANGKQFVSSEHSFDDDFGKPTSFANHKQFVCSEHSCNKDVKNPSAFANRKQFVRAEHS